MNKKKYFELLKVLGKGSYGSVLQVRHKETNKIYFIKLIKKKKLNKNYLKNRY